MTEGAERERLNTVHRVLADERRRDVLAFLARIPEGHATLDQLARYLDSESTAESDCSTTRARLHHVTIPTLADAGIVEYDFRSETVRYSPEPRIAELIDECGRGERVHV